MAKRTAVFCWTVTMDVYEILILILVLALVFLAILFYECICQLKTDHFRN